MYVYICDNNEIYCINYHQKFTEELLAKRSHIYEVLEKGNQILQEAHPDAVSILQDMIQAVEDRWKELNKMASDYSEKLATALLELQGVEEWLEHLSRWAEMKKLALAQLKPEGIKALTSEDIKTQLTELQVCKY